TAPTTAVANCRCHLLYRCHSSPCRNRRQPPLPPTTAFAAASSTFSPAPIITVATLASHLLPSLPSRHLPHLPPLIARAKPRLYSLVLPPRPLPLPPIAAIPSPR
ncbi:hypothetical protein GW17_00036869, partial [Ensete ventricosum]